MTIWDAIVDLFGDEETRRRRHALALAAGGHDAGDIGADSPFAFDLPNMGKGFRGREGGNSGVNYDSVQEFLTSIIAAANERQGYIPAGLREAAANSPEGFGFSADWGAGQGGGAPADPGGGSYYDAAPSYYDAAPAAPAAAVFSRQSVPIGYSPPPGTPARTSVPIAIQQAASYQPGSGSAFVKAI